jgi:hypothetical protein
MTIVKCEYKSNTATQAPRDTSEWFHKMHLTQLATCWLQGGMTGYLPVLVEQYIAVLSENMGVTAAMATSLLGQDLSDHANHMTTARGSCSNQSEGSISHTNYVSLPKANTTSHQRQILRTGIWRGETLTKDRRGNEDPHRRLQGTRVNSGQNNKKENRAAWPGTCLHGNSDSGVGYGCHILQLREVEASAKEVQGHPVGGAGQDRCDKREGVCKEYLILHLKDKDEGHHQPGG